jgi:hypothetical protein
VARRDVVDLVLIVVRVIYAIQLFAVRACFLTVSLLECALRAGESERCLLARWLLACFDARLPILVVRNNMSGLTECPLADKNARL